MVTHFDEKGKIFTNIIAKKPMPVTIQTRTHRIHGEVHIRPEERIKDELDRTSAFLAVTAAEVFSADGQILEVKSEFMVVNVNEIVWLIPDEDRTSEGKDHE